MREIDRILQKIETHINNGTFEELETEKVEIKDLSTKGDWGEFYKSVCAFLNTDGGIVIIGVNESSKTPKQYKFTGYNASNEGNLKIVSDKFRDKDGLPQNVNEYFPNPEIKEFMSGKVCLFFVEKLPEDKKFVFYDGDAYERRLTGDHKIKDEKIEAQEDLKRDIQDAKEVEIVEKANLSLIDLDRLNDYILRLNRDVKVESIKADIDVALPFLLRKSFVREGKPTLLGILVCGDNPYDWIGGRCQVDCFVDSDIQVAQNKQVLKDNVIPLMESAIGFVFKNIAVGVSYEGGGASLPEYPEKLIREVVNNALAHRDYESDKFVNIVIKPNTHIEIRNPGKFRPDQKLILDSPIKVRRIIPNPKPKNPRLADVLKIYDRWEGRGLGMASLTNACLENQIDVPYFIFRSPNDISLFIPKGQVLDEESERWLSGFSGWIYRNTNGRELTREEKTVLAYFYKSEQLNINERYSILLTPDNNHFEVIANLSGYSLIQKIESSNHIYPLYIVNRTLAQKDFYSALRDIFGGSFDNLGEDYKDVLDTIFLHNEYSMRKEVSAKEVDLFIYTRRHKLIKDLRHYDTYSRKVRNIVNTLERKNFIVRADGVKPRYIINKNFVRTTSLFD